MGETKAIDLIQKQTFELDDFYNMVNAADKTGKPGIILAQVFETCMLVRFFEHDQAKQISELLTGNSH